MDDKYRQRKIDHVTGLTGGSIWEINQVTIVAPAAALLWTILQTRQKFFEPYTFAAYVTDFLIHVGGILFACTAYSEQPVVLIGLMLLPAIATIINTTDPEDKKFAKPNPKPETEPEEIEPVDAVPIKPFVTTYRGAMMIITCICILAVDFKIFPRRFAKVENWGTSLMDLGVGSFVFGAGVITAKQPLKNEQQEIQRSTFLQRFNDALRHSLPLLALGFVRLYSVKASNYQEHVTEYGVHWNFFFTLGLLPPMVAIFQSFINIIPSHQALAFAIVLPYEMSFWYSNVGYYIFTAERTDFFSSNREGIYSFIGYLAIFIAR